MKYCPKCGVPLENDEARFCPKCGTSIMSDDMNDSNESVMSDDTNDSNEFAKTDKTVKSGGIGEWNIFDKDNEKSSIFKGLVAAGVVVLLVLLFIPHRPSFSIKDYVKDIEYEGFNGEATAYYDFDVNSLEEDILKKKKMNDEKKSELHRLLSMLSDEIKISKRDGLANGDKFTITISDDDSVLDDIKQLGVSVKNAEISTKVKGLRDVAYIQLSEDFISVDVSGYLEEPDVRCSVDQDAFYKSFKSGVNKKTDVLDEHELSVAYDYISDGLKAVLKDTEISNDTEVTYTISAMDDQALLKDAGIIFKDTDIKVKVKNLQNMTEVDLADCILVDIQGSVPDLYLDITCDTKNPASQIITSWTPESQEYSGNNGDVVEIEISYDSDLAHQLGYKVTNTHKSVTISGASTYMIDSEDITTDQWKDILEKTESKLKNEYFKDSELLDSMNEKFSDTGIRILWNYFEVQPYEVINVYAENSENSGNVVSLVYQVQISLLRSDETIGTYTFYRAISIKDLAKSEDGLFEDYDNYFDDGCKGYYSDAKELSSLEENIESWLNEEYSEATINKKVTLNTDLTVVTVPESVEKTESETKALLKEEKTKTEFPEIDSEIETKASAMLEYDGHRYYRFDIAYTWEEAEKFCQNYGYHLASIGNSKEQKLLYALIDSDYNDPSYNLYWTGAHYVNGKWTWTDETEDNYNAWYKEEPYNDSEEYPYALVSRDDDGLLVNVENEKEKVGFIMEVDAVNLSNKKVTYLEDRRVTDNKNVFYVMEDSFHEVHYAATCLDQDENSYTVYNLDGEFSSFSGSLFVSDDTDTESDMTFSIFGDGKLLYHQVNLNRQSNDISFNINVTGVQNLVLELRNMGNGDCKLILDCAKLYVAESRADSCNYTDLRSLEPVDGNYYEVYNRLIRDNTGHWHDGTIRFEANSDSFAVWNLNYGYTKAEFAVEIPDCGDADTSVIVNVYGDDVLLDSSSHMNRTSDAYHFPSDIDLSGVRLLKIEVINQGEGSDVYGDLVDARLFQTAK